MRGQLVETLEQRTLLAGTISGFVFDDLNGNGARETGEPGLADMGVYLDLNLNGFHDKREPFQVTDASGAYSFTGLEDGPYRVRHDAPGGRRLSAPHAIFHDLTIAGDTTFTNRTFGNTDTAVIRGTVFRDLNKDTLKQSNEPGLPGWTVYIDKNNNGQYDPGVEKVRVTNSRGEYRFAGLTPGTYRIRIVQQTGHARTNPISGLWVVKDLTFAQSLSNRNFGQNELTDERP